MTPFFRALLPVLLLGAQAAPAATLSLSGYLDGVRAKDPALAQAQVEAEARAAQLEQDAAWSNPDLSIQGGPKNSADASGTMLAAGLNQGFLWPGKRALRRQLARLERDSAQLTRRLAEAETLEQALGAALDYASAKLHLAAALDRQKRLEPVRSFLASQTFASPQQKTDRDVVEARLRNLEAGLASLEADLEGSRSRLALLMGADEAVDLDWEPPLNPEAAQTPGLEAVLAANPALQASKLREAQAEARMALAQKEPLPDPEFSLGYLREDLGGEEQTLSAGLSVPLPLLNANKAGKQAAAGQKKAAEAESAALRRGIKLRSQAALQRLKGLRAAAKAYPPGFEEKLEGGLKEAERQLRIGRLALISYLEYESEAAASREALLDLRLEQARALLELNALAGGLEAPAAFLGGKEPGHAE